MILPKLTIDANYVAALRENINNEIEKSGDWYYNAEEDFYYYNAPLRGKQYSYIIYTGNNSRRRMDNKHSRPDFFYQTSGQKLFRKKYFTPKREGDMITSWGGVTTETYDAQ